MNWIRYNRRNCPVCNGARNDCRENQTTKLVHCRDNTTTPDDWIFRGKDAWGFNMWAYAPDVEAQRAENLAKWKQSPETRQKIREQKLLEKQARSLPDREKDKLIKQILSQLSLSGKHRQHLRDRGLTDEQIDDAGYRSVGKWQKLAIPVDDNLAGVRLGGESLLTPESGILCPIRNQVGQYVSWQLRQDNNSQAKYIWAASERKRHHRPTSHNKQYGELPLGVWIPNSTVPNATRGVVGLTEGTTIKPHIASHLLKIPVIGASGGNFASSSKTLFDTLEHLSAQEIILYPDAGAVINPNVLNQYKKVFGLLKQWNYDVQVAWWQQITKEDGDIDEIFGVTLSQITYLSPDAFISLAEKQQYIAGTRDSWRKSKHFTAQKQIHQRHFKSKLPASNTATFIKSTTGSGKTTNLVKWLAELKDMGAICLGYRNTLLLQWCADSGFYHLHEHDGLNLIGWDSSRIALCIDSLWRFKPSDFEGKVLILDEVCSVIRHGLFSQTVKNRERILNLFAEAIRRCERLICLDGMMADWVVGYLTALCPDKKISTIENTWRNNKAPVNFLMGVEIDGKLKVNDRSPWLDELLNFAPVPAIGLDSQVFGESLDNLLSERGYDVLRIDSKTVKEKSVKEFLGGGGTKKKNENQNISPSDCAKRTSQADRYLTKYKPDVLIYTPSAESGVDVSITNYFSHHFCFFFGVLQVDAILQLMARIRDVSCPKYFWCKQWVSLPESETIRSPLADKIAKVVDQNLVRDIRLSMAGEEDEELLISQIRSVFRQSKTPHYNTANQLTAIANYEKSNLRECVLESLEAHGYSVNLVTGKDSWEIKQEVKAATKFVKEHNCQDIFNSEDIPPELADKPLAFDAGWEDRCKLIKALLKRRLPGIEDSQRWNPELIYKLRYAEPGFIEKQELFWLLNNPDVAKTLQQEKYHFLCRKFIEYEQVSLWKIKTRLATISALRELGVHELLNNLDNQYTNESPEILAIWNKGHKTKYRQVLGRSPGQHPIRYVGSLLRMLGHGWQSKQVRVSLESIRIYQLNRQLIEDDDRQVILQCIGNKYQKYLRDEVEHLDWSLTDQVTEKIKYIQEKQSELATNRAESKLVERSARSITPQGLDPVTEPPKNVDKPDSVSVTEKVDNKSNDLDRSSEVGNTVISPSRPQLTDYQDKEIVWFKSTWGWLKGWIFQQLTMNNGRTQ
ncbi:MAG: hypothetical protein QNJ72_41760 [Pleurocapsa sp. MO_226.B13]|nr:hypothetical protein [Pleurocapsa sp. MO_226.B13]